jgi:aspartate-semialdehyde dehydrogenase
MTTARRDFDIPAGQTLEFVVDVVGGPANLTGYVGSMMIRELRSDAVPVATIPPAAITVNSGTRQVKVTIPSSETEDYTFRRGVYDLIITGAGGDEWRLVEGRITTSMAVTR